MTKITPALARRIRLAKEAVVAHFPRAYAVTLTPSLVRVQQGAEVLGFGRDHLTAWENAAAATAGQEVAHV